MQRYDKSPTWANKKHAEETQHVFSSSTHIAKPCFNFKTSLRHSFWLFSKLIETCDTLFSHFQNHLALATPFFARFQNHLAFATLFSVVFKIDWPLRHSFHPFSKSFGPRDTLFARFQNHLAFATLFSVVFKIDWPLRHSFHPFSKPIDMRHLGGLNQSVSVLGVCMRRASSAWQAPRSRRDRLCLCSLAGETRRRRRFAAS